jgi:phosphoglycerate dehydrogenase-like enzyme
VESPRIAVVPDSIPAIRDAVEAGGGTVVDPPDAGGVIWTDPRDSGGLADLLDEHGDHLRWVHLPYAGIERWAGILDRDRTWTCAKEIYGHQVAELALGLLLAGFRNLGRYAAATTWTDLGERNLLGTRVVILGGGGIAEHLIAMLTPFRCTVDVVRRHPGPMDGADRVVGSGELHDVLAGADAAVVALALTPETRGIVGAAELALMADHAWLVNVARGPHVVTDDLVAALGAGTIGGAGLDVTDPEPLPDGHPLWDLDNCIITPHVGNTWDMAVPSLAAQTSENVRRFGTGEQLTGLVDVDLGY